VNLSYPFCCVLFLIYIIQYKLFIYKLLFVITFNHNAKLTGLILCIAVFFHYFRTPVIITTNTVNTQINIQVNKITLQKLIIAFKFWLYTQVSPSIIGYTNFSIQIQILRAYKTERFNES